MYSEEIKVWMKFKCEVWRFQPLHNQKGLAVIQACRSHTGNLVRRHFPNNVMNNKDRGAAAKFRCHEQAHD